MPTAVPTRAAAATTSRLIFPRIFIRGAGISVNPDGNELEEIRRLIDGKKIKVIVSQIFPLRDAAKAQADLADGEHVAGTQRLFDRVAVAALVSLPVHRSSLVEPGREAAERAVPGLTF